MVDYRLRTASLALAVATLAVTTLAGCAVGPNYKQPPVALDAAFVNAGGKTNPAAPSADIALFWRGFKDPALDALIDQALAANGDVRVAQARLQEARADRAGADSELLPSGGLDSGIKRSVTPITQRSTASRSERTGTTFDAGFVANWELDFFGRLRRGSESAAARVSASEAGVGAAQTAVAAEVARNYLELRGLQQRLGVVERSLANQRESLRITQARFDAGRAIQLDLSRSQALLAATEAQRPALQTALERSVFRLATLSAQPPKGLLERLTVPAPLPTLPVTDLATLPVGTPQLWLERRPDVRSAERQLAAATAAIGIAKADLFPRITLSGLLGLNAATLGNLVNSDSGVYSLGARLIWAPFDSGLLRSRINASEARTQQSLATYEQTVLLALEETEGAFSAFNRSAERAQKLDSAAGHAEEAARIARLRYEAGVTDFLPVLDAEREVLSNRDQWVQAQTGTATALVALYRALGGGWSGAAQASANSNAGAR